MRKISKFFVGIVFTLLFVSVSATAAKAQELPNYLFIQVVDSNGKPVEDATAQAAFHNWENNEYKQSWSRDEQTNPNGETQILLPGHHYDFSLPVFRVTKSEYFPYIDLGTPIIYPVVTKFKLELLKIPKSPEEQKALGNEQQKREFMWAAKSGDTKAIRRLLKSGINPNITTSDLRGISAPENIPAIMFAAAAGKGETIELMLKAGAKVRHKESLHDILAHYIKASPYAGYDPQTGTEKANLMQKYEDGLKRLIKAGAALTNLEIRRQTALVIAAQQSQINVIKILLKKGLPINARNGSGATPLFYVNEFKDEAKIEFLLESGADPNIISNADNINCSSILMQAVPSRNTNLIKALIAHNADINFTCKSGSNALKMAKQFGATEIVKLLEEAGAKE